MSSSASDSPKKASRRARPSTAGSGTGASKNVIKTPDGAADKKPDRTKKRAGTHHDASHKPDAKRPNSVTQTPPAPTEAAAKSATRGGASRTRKRAKRAPKKLGSKGKYSKATVDALIASIAAGETNKGAAASVGLSEAQFYVWMDERPEFAEQVACARTNRRKALLARIESASEKDWRATAWLLERYHPDEFARQRLEISGPNGAPIEMTTALDKEIAAEVRKNPGALGDVQKLLASIVGRDKRA